MPREKDSGFALVSTGFKVRTIQSTTMWRKRALVKPWTKGKMDKQTNTPDPYIVLYLQTTQKIKRFLSVKANVTFNI